MTSVGIPPAGVVSPEPPPEPPRAVASPALSGRLAALARVSGIAAARQGPEGFSPGLVADAEELLARAGERLRLAADATVVVLAGGTGGGKSSLFNRLVGATFSPVGAVRPVTREPCACVWGVERSGPLLDWLGVPDRRRFAHTSELDNGEDPLAGLLLIDTPDHDSVLTQPGGTVNRLVELADLMIWVLDPQKYADASVHSRYLLPMATHASLIAVVLNQSDLLSPADVTDCESDLRRLLESEGLRDAPILVTSAATGDGLAELRRMMSDTVAARRAALARISANVDAVSARFLPTAGGAEALGSLAAPRERWKLEGPVETSLTDAFARAAGVAGIARALASARDLKAADYLGWPVFWLAERVLRRHRLHEDQRGGLWDELCGGPAQEAGAQQAQIDAAIVRLGEEVGAGLPAPWANGVREAARAGAADIPRAVGAAIAQALPAANQVSRWWRLVAAWQGLLLGGAVGALAWLVSLLVVAGFGLPEGRALYSDTALLPWVLVMGVAILMLGWLTASACMTRAGRIAGIEREAAEARMRAGVADVARRMVILPVISELSEYDRFRAELAAALGVG